MANKKKDKGENFVSTWTDVIMNSKTKVKRYFHKDDTNHQTPYLFDGYRRDFVTGEKLVAFHTKKGWDEETDSYPSFVLPVTTFLELFKEVEVEI